MKLPARHLVSLAPSGVFGMNLKFLRPSRLPSCALKESLCLTAEQLFSTQGFHFQPDRQAALTGGN